MSKVIRISEEIFARLQKHSVPLEDTPASVIERILDHYEKTNPRIEDYFWLKFQTGTIGPCGSSVIEPYREDRPDLYLAPANEANLEATINRSQSIKVAENILEQEQLVALKEALNGKTEFNCWAMTKNSRSKFNAMKKGDYVLFTPKGSGRFSYCARVIHKLESASLGAKLWSVVPGLPWELIYFLEDVSNINIPKEILVSALGYDQGYVVPGIIRVNSERVKNALSASKSIPDFISSLSI